MKKRRRKVWVFERQFKIIDGLYGQPGHCQASEDGPLNSLPTN